MQQSNVKSRLSFRWLNRERLSRYWSNQELRKLAPLFHGDIANVSAGDDLDKEGGLYEGYFCNKQAYYITNHRPGSFRGYRGRDNEFLIDLTDAPPKELVERFDAILNHSTLEHIFDVRIAFRNLCKLTRDVAIVVVPFVHAQHEVEGSYGDFWRFTPGVMRALFGENGMDVVYESVSPYQDTTIYMLFIGSKYPQRWRDRLPSYVPLSEVGAWIGRNHSLFYAPWMLYQRLSRAFSQPQGR